MVREMAMTAARKGLTSLPRLLARDRSTVAVTRRGKRVLALLPWDVYESIVETLEILGDPDLMKALRAGIREIEQGKGIPWEQARPRLGA